MILLFLALSLHTAPQLSALAPSLTTSPAPVLSCIFFRVNNPAADLSRYPATLKASSAPEAVIYQQQPGYYALHYPQEPETQPAGALAVFREGEGAIALFQGSPPSRRQTTQPPLPVYGPQGSSDFPLAIPTGEIFVRFRAGIPAQDRAAALNTAGYEITKVLDFAPQGAWVRSRSGTTLDSLQQIDQLRSLADVENVEPQMLMERRSR